ncbi:MAG: SAM-dependent methyltransferase [Flavobacteriaceae bacterium]|nr:SAM-dependent methyltransferase [Flavobacteriaceae bacterium]
MTNYYKKVYATDPSEQQLKHAVPHKQIEYRVEKAEKTTLAAASADVITVSQALHWFEFDRFYTEVNRVLKPDGILAAWTYGIPKISEAVDTVITYFYDTILNGYWKPGNQLVAERYATIPFPFQEVESPTFTIEKPLSLDDVIGLLTSWSAVQRYINRNDGQNPIDEIKGSLAKAWKKGGNLKASEWEICMRVGMR